MSRWLVTGCAGFVGSHLVEALLARGDAVVGVDAFTDYYPRARKEENLAEARASAAFSLVEADLAEVALEPLLEDVDGVFHLAAQPGVRGSWGESFAVYVRDNVLATQRLLEAAADAGARAVLASSSSVYGEAEAYPTAETVEPRPISPYGVTKLSCEHLARAYASGRGLDVAVLRYFTVYGPRQRPDMGFAQAIGALVEGRPFRVFGTGEQSRDVTYVGDAVSAAVAAMDGAPSGAVYNVGGGTETTLLGALAVGERPAGRRLELSFEPAAAGDVRRTAADTARIRAELGWAPATGLEEGLAAQLAWAAATVAPR
jgi:nucleoside-diphosphate-sugar epimerase